MSLNIQPISHAPFYSPILEGLEENLPNAETPDLATWKKVAVFGASVVGGALFAPAAGAGLAVVASTLIASSIASMFAEEVATLALGGKTNNTHLISAALAFANGNFGQAQNNFGEFAGAAGWGLLFGVLSTLLPIPLGTLVGNHLAIPETALANGAEKLVAPAKEVGEEAAEAMMRGFTGVHFDDDKNVLMLIAHKLSFDLEKIGKKLEVITPDKFNESRHLINKAVPNNTVRLWQFSNPEQGRQFVKENAVDFAIIDGRMGTEYTYGLDYADELIKEKPEILRIFLSSDDLATRREHSKLPDPEKVLKTCIHIVKETRTTNRELVEKVIGHLSPK